MKFRLSENDLEMQDKIYNYAVLIMGFHVKFL